MKTKRPVSKRKSKAAKATSRKPKRTSRGRAKKPQPKQLFPFAEAIDLAKKARPLVDLSQPVIFHGSRHPKCILEINALLSATRRAPGAEVPPIAISCTRSLHVALYWAMLERNGGDESRGAVFVLDRTRLAQDFRLQTYRDSFWDHVPERSERRCSECEERISGHVFDLHRYLATSYGSMRRPAQCDRVTGSAIYVRIGAKHQSVPSQSAAFFRIKLCRNGKTISHLNRTQFTGRAITVTVRRCHLFSGLSLHEGRCSHVTQRTSI
jgi:hypothetical protein